MSSEPTVSEHQPGGAERPSFAAGDVVAGALTTALGVGFLVSAWDIENPGSDPFGGPHVVPLAAAWILTGLGGAILAAAFWRPSAPAPSKSPTAIPLLILLGGLGYTWLIDWLGYLPATLLTAPLAFLGFGATSLRKAIAPGLCVALSIYAIFFVALGIYDPPGRYFDYRSVLDVLTPGG